MAIKYDRFDPESALPQLEKVIDKLIDKVYPVGSCYITTNSRFDPNREFTGRWELESSNPYNWNRVS